ncbi:hypothetical protein [Roseixanthobacter glucoisosaccharinicivorans]|uniref:hypothetical protein n=1 Tax=Roseixanthobacter glucoisosaccharinicivorans TaxID=3119923 RepID=UPI003728D984
MRKPKYRPCKAERWGILNHVGDMWTPDTFETKDEAQRYIETYAKKFGIELSNHKPVRVIVVVSVDSGEKK